MRIAIDDFGTGYSALAYLKQLPIDVLKIDQSFVQTLTTDPADATITEMIVKLAAGLNLTTIAEGVETFEQLLLLGSLAASGCRDSVRQAGAGRDVRDVAEAPAVPLGAGHRPAARGRAARWGEVG